MRRVFLACVMAAGIAAISSSPAQAVHGPPHEKDCKYANTPVPKLHPKPFIAEIRAASAVHCLINRARRQNGVAPLETYKALRGSKPYSLGLAARTHARESVRLKWWDPNNGLASHVHPDSGLPHTFEGARQQIAARIAAAGHCPNGTPNVNENTFAWSGTADPVSGGAPTPGGAVKWWLWDPPHRATLLSPAYTEHGIGVVIGLAFPGTEYYPAATFVQDLGSCG
jgi:hypothetical protein